MTDVVTTGHRTHRALRLSLAVVVLGLFVAIGVQVAVTGEWLPSISHYVYTPARDVFVGALVAAGLALIVLAGRDLETVFLDIAAVFAPLVAIVPTGITPELLTRLTGESVQMGPCDPDGNCIPEVALDAVRTGVVSYTAVLAVTVVLVLWARRRDLRPATLAAPAVAVVVAVVLNLAAFVGPISAGFPFNPWLGITVHFAVTILFFAAFTAVPVTQAVRWWRMRRGTERRSPGEPVIRPWRAAVYVAVPLLMIADVAVLTVFVARDAAGPGVLVCEAIALALFAFFWVVQTAQRWREPDQASLLPER